MLLQKGRGRGKMMLCGQLIEVSVAVSLGVALIHFPFPYSDAGDASDGALMYPDSAEVLGN